MIRAEMHDGSYIRVSPKGLDLLLRNGRVKRFLRNSGWTVVGIDPIRAQSRHAQYGGPERRNCWSFQSAPCPC
jgi:hypothetical protein